MSTVDIVQQAGAQNSRLKVNKQKLVEVGALAGLAAGVLVCYLVIYDIIMGAF